MELEVTKTYFYGPVYFSKQISDRQGPINLLKFSRRLKVSQMQRREQLKSIVDSIISSRNKMRNSSQAYATHTRAHQKVKECSTFLFSFYKKILSSIFQRVRSHYVEHRNLMSALIRNAKKAIIRIRKKKTYLVMLFSVYVKKQWNLWHVQLHSFVGFHLF